MKKIRIVAFLSAVVVFMLSYLYFQGQKTSQEITEDREEIVIAKLNIKPNEVITEEMVELKVIPVLKDDQDYFTNLGEVVGRITITDVFVGEKITKLRTVDKDSTLDLTYKIAEGMRAMAVAVDKEAGVGHNIKVGDYVDVISDGKIEAGRINDIPTPAGMAFDSSIGPEMPRNTTILHTNVDDGYVTLAIQNVKVLALDSVTYFEAKKEGEEREYQTVTLEVTPEQARYLALVRLDDDRAHLLLRAHGDDEITDDPRQDMFKSEAPVSEGEVSLESLGTDNSENSEERSGGEANRAFNQGAGGQSKGAETEDKPVVR